MLIRDILNLKGGTIYSLEGSDALTRAVGIMVKHDIGSLVVMESGGMVGMLTFREILQALDAQRDLSQTQARQVMVKDPVCGSPGDTIEELRELMTRNHIRYLPVKDGERLAGVVSFHDVAKAIMKETSMENRLLRRYIESQPAERT